MNLLVFAKRRVLYHIPEDGVKWGSETFLIFPTSSLAPSTRRPTTSRSDLTCAAVSRLSMRYVDSVFWSARLVSAKYLIASSIAGFDPFFAFFARHSMSSAKEAMAYTPKTGRAIGLSDRNHSLGWWISPFLGYVHLISASDSLNRLRTPSPRSWTTTTCPSIFSLLMGAYCTISPPSASSAKRKISMENKTLPTCKDGEGFRLHVHRGQNSPSPTSSIEAAPAFTDMRNAMKSAFSSAVNSHGFPSRIARSKACVVYVMPALFVASQE